MDRDFFGDVTSLFLLVLTPQITLTAPVWPLSAAPPFISSNSLLVIDVYQERFYPHVKEKRPPF